MTAGLPACAIVVVGYPLHSPVPFVDQNGFSSFLGSIFSSSKTKNFKQF